MYHKLLRTYMHTKTKRSQAVHSRVDAASIARLVYACSTITSQVISWVEKMQMLGGRGSINKEPDRGLNYPDTLFTPPSSARRQEGDEMRGLFLTRVEVGGWMEWLEDTQRENSELRTFYSQQGR
jgi:hypothetical protein